MKEENLIFIVSQPRSGSTYLQNLLSNNEETNTCSEPWLLLNFANQMKPELIKAEFDNKLAVDAFKDYLYKYPNFDFSKIQKQFLLSLYNPMFDGYKLVIDKTPRYWEILDEIVAIFPKSKIIILKRNPIDVAKSIITTWNIPSLEKLYYFKRDLLLAPKQIQSFFSQHGNSHNIYMIRYEDLVANTATEVKKIYKWIGLKYDASVLEISKNQKYKGRYGDPYQNSNNSYASVKEESNSKKLDIKFKDFLIGYNHFFGSDFLEKYGNYHQNGFELKKTRSFIYFMFIDECNIKKKSLKREIVSLMKKYYFKLRIIKYFS